MTTEPTDSTEATDSIVRVRGIRLLLVHTALWLIFLFVALPMLAFGLERSGAIFGRWGDWPEWWQRDMWLLAIGTGLLFVTVVTGLCLSILHRRWFSGVLFSLVLAAAMTLYSAVHQAHPERSRMSWTWSTA